MQVYNTRASTRVASVRARVSGALSLADHDFRGSIHGLILGPLISTYVFERPWGVFFREQLPTRCMQW